MKDCPRIYLHCPGCISAAGIGLEQTAAGIFSPLPGQLPLCAGLLGEGPIPYGRVEEAGPLDGRPVDGAVRTHRLIDLCLETMDGLGRTLSGFKRERIGVVLGASTSGMREIEAGVAHQLASGRFDGNFTADALNLGEPARHLAGRLAAGGPAYSISNACASGSMAVASAAALIRAGVIDAAVTGGIDGFSRFTVAGFHALGALSLQQCRPFAAGRNGINLGEGGALMVVSREPGPVELAGWGATCDAHHPSAPEPEGIEASRAMSLALQRAGMAPDEIDFVSAHGTATPLNDAMEARAVHRVFGASVPMASLKGRTGHTLAAAGALQAAYAWILLAMNPEGRLPANTSGCARDPALAAVDLVEKPRTLGRPLAAVAGNAFAFGGSNSVLVFRSNL